MFDNHLEYHNCTQLRGEKVNKQAIKMIVFGKTTTTTTKESLLFVTNKLTVSLCVCACVSPAVVAALSYVIPHIPESVEFNLGDFGSRSKQVRSLFLSETINVPKLLKNFFSVQTFHADVNMDGSGLLHHSGFTAHSGKNDSSRQHGSIAPLPRLIFPRNVLHDGKRQLQHSFSEKIPVKI